jgi:hypothetical protein
MSGSSPVSKESTSVDNALPKEVWGCLEGQLESKSSASFVSFSDGSSTPKFLCASASAFFNLYLEEFLWTSCVHHLE